MTIFNILYCVRFFLSILVYNPCSSADNGYFKEERENELMAKVGQLTIENDWLKSVTVPRLEPQPCNFSING